LYFLIIERELEDKNKDDAITHIILDKPIISKEKKKKQIIKLE
jgi:hypothetical protein